MLPATTHSFPRHSEKLFGRFVVDRQLVRGDDIRFLTPQVNKTFIDFMIKIGFLEELNVPALVKEWKAEGLWRWWDAVEGETSLSICIACIYFTERESEQQELFFDLWSFLISAFPKKTAKDFACVLTHDKKWVCPTEVCFLAPLTLIPLR